MKDDVWSGFFRLALLSFSLQQQKGEHKPLFLKSNNEKKKTIILEFFFMSTFSRLQKGVDCCDVYVQLYDIVFALTKNCMFRLNGGVVLKRFFFCKDFFFFQNQETIANADKGSKQKRCRKLERKKTRQVEKKNN